MKLYFKAGPKVKALPTLLKDTTNNPYRAVGEYMSATWLPAFVRAGGLGEWKTPLRGGTPMYDTGKWSQGFVYSVGEKSTRIWNMRFPQNIQHVHEFGAVIKAKNAPYLRFQINGKWFRKKQVTIPARPLWIWRPEMIAAAMRIFKSAILDRVSAL